MLTFYRKTKQNEVVVGKFNVILKIVNDYMAGSESMFDGANLTVPRGSRQPGGDNPVFL